MWQPFNPKISKVGYIKPQRCIKHRYLWYKTNKTEQRDAAKKCEICIFYSLKSRIYENAMAQMAVRRGHILPFQLIAEAWVRIPNLAPTILIGSVFFFVQNDPGYFVQNDLVIMLSPN